MGLLEEFLLASGDCENVGDFANYSKKINFNNTTYIL
jgi:hypothetical protein